MYTRLNVRCLLLFSDFKQICIFSTFFEETQILNFINIRPVGDMTDMTTLVAALGNFVNAAETLIIVLWKTFFELMTAEEIKSRSVILLPCPHVPSNKVLNFISIHKIQTKQNCFPLTVT